MIINILNKLYNLPRFIRILYLILIDCFSIFIAVTLALKTTNQFNINFFNWIILVNILISIPIYFYSGIYYNITRYIGSYTYYNLTKLNIVNVLFTFLFGLIFNLEGPKIIVYIEIIILQTLLIISSRTIIKDIVLKLKKNKSNKVAIYGAGEAGSQLLASLRLSGNLNTVVFFDDNPNLWGKKSIKYQFILHQ